MVRLLIDQAQLVIELAAVERALAFRKESVRVPRADIRRVLLTDDPWTWLQGVRKPGTHIGRRLAAGTWVRTAGRDFVLLRGRGHDGVVITLRDHEFQRIVLSTPHAKALVEALQVEEVGTQTDVIDLVED
ncbi:hypothetical protein [Microbacterium halophytorum]|uniref:hypothetical protein n=1 Tax=Microbacterium halophytorum TaxID=2067568 RepID=UPI000CFBD73C|nr:hypothetical protein [Microbacterium halophytorum]